MCWGEEGSPFSCLRLLNKEEVGGNLSFYLIMQLPIMVKHGGLF